MVFVLKKRLQMQSLLMLIFAALSAGGWYPPLQILRIKSRLSGRLLVSKSGLTSKRQARTILLRGSIPVRSVTEQNMGDCADLLPSKDNKILRNRLN